MCYRRDLFEEAGLPTDRDEVAALWPTWEDFIAVGEQFQAGDRPRRRALHRLGHQHLQLDPDAVAATTPTSTPTATSSSRTTRRSRRRGTRRWRCRTPGISAKLKSFSNEWNAGFKNGSFATIACPAWMTGYIKEQAGDENAGKWDITTVPGRRRQLGRLVPRGPDAEQEPGAGIELVDFLTSADGQLAAFEAVGNLPSNPTLYDDPALKDADQRVLQRRAGRPDLRGRRQPASSRSTSAPRTSRSATRSRTPCAASRTARSRRTTAGPTARRATPEGRRRLTRPSPAGRRVRGPRQARTRRPIHRSQPEPRRRSST